MPHVSSDMFTRNIPQWETQLARFAGKPELQVLEIGTYEGMAACWLLQYVATHPTSHVTCIDLFKPFHFVSDPPKEDEPVIIDLSSRFDANIVETGQAHRVTKMAGDSKSLLRTLPRETFHIIYVDGGHQPRHALRDMILAWDVLREDGVMIIDDYGLQDAINPENNPKIAIDAFLECMKHELELLHKDYQVIIRKTHAEYPEQAPHFVLPRSYLPNA